MNKTINLILAILSVITYIGIIVMKFYTQINIPNGSFVIMTLLFIISVFLFLISLNLSTHEENMCIPRHSSGLLVGIIINLININKS